MTGRARLPLVAVLLAAVGGLVLAAATGATWVTRTTTRELAGIAVSDVTRTPGTAVAPAGVPLGLAALLGSLALLLPGRLARAGGVLLALLGLAAVVATAAALPAAAALPGRVGPAPGLAVLGGLAVTAAGVLAARAAGARPRMSARFSLEGAEDDDEWRLASADEDP